MENVEIEDDSAVITQLLEELIKKVNDSPKKSRYRSLVVTHLEIAEGFLSKDQKSS